MPLVTIKLIEGVFTQEQKQQMIDRVTEAMLSVEGENMRPVTWVLIEDNIKSGDWGIGGHGVTVEAVHAIQQGKAKAPSVG
jgi:4-oxalocrotonate tautomerase